MAQNVGIGTTSPEEMLHVNGISLHEGLKVDINGNTRMAILPNDGPETTIDIRTHWGQLLRPELLPVLLMMSLSRLLLPITTTRILKFDMEDMV